MALQNCMAINTKLQNVKPLQDYKGHLIADQPRTLNEVHHKNILYVMECMIGIAELHHHQYKITGCKTYSSIIEMHDWHIAENASP